MRFLLRNLTSCSINKLTSLKFQVQLPIYNVRAIMHGLHDLTGNDDKSLKGESLGKVLEDVTCIFGQICFVI